MNRCINETTKKKQAGGAARITYNNKMQDDVESNDTLKDNRIRKKKTGLQVPLKLTEKPKKFSNFIVGLKYRITNNTFI